MLYRILEGNGLNYQPITDLLFLKRQLYIYRPVHYLVCFVCFLDVVLLDTCRKFTKETNYTQIYAL